MRNFSLILALVVACCSAVSGSQNPYGGYGAPPPSHQQQQQGQQQGRPYGQQGAPNPYGPPPGQYPPQQGPPAGYHPGPGALVVPHRGAQPQDQQQQGGGFFAKFKQGLAAAGSALVGGPDIAGPPQQQQQPYGRAPGGQGQFPPRQSGPLPPAAAGQFRQGPPPGQQQIPPRGPGYDGGYRGAQPGRPQQQQSGEEGGGLLGKLKNLFSADEPRDDLNQQPQQQQLRPPAYGAPPPGGSRAPPQPGFPESYGGYPPVGSGPPPHPSDSLLQQQQQQQQYPPATAAPGGSSYGQQQGPDSQWGQKPSTPPGYQQQQYPPQQQPGFGPPPRYPEGPDSQQQQQLYGQPPQPQQQQQPGAYGQPYDILGPQGYPLSQEQQQQQQYGQQQQLGGFPPLPEPEPDLSLQVSPEPQALVVDGSIVFILKPREYFRKKQAITRDGPGSVQVFSDFEHVITHVKTAEGEKTLGSAEVLECAQGALSPIAIQQLRAVAAEFAAIDDVDMDDSRFEDFTSRCQNIVTRDGMLHVGSIAPATRDLLNQVGLRAGWKDALQALAQEGVPAFIFSSGYGDVVSQALLQGGLSDSRGSAAASGASAVSSFLPQNIRIISNFFRTAPDGTVRAFSQPIVHERNKNVTTAARHMGFPVPDRPNAIVFGAHEDDVLMTEGVQGLREQISVGFLELTDDFALRLPNFLSTYDAVVVGEGNFAFAKSLVEEVLGVPSTNAVAGQKRESFLDKARGVLQFQGGVADIF